jgi:hypothetical protein
MAQVEFCESCTDLLNIYEAIGRAKPTLLVAGSKGIQLMTRLFTADPNVYSCYLQTRKYIDRFI